MRLSRQQGCRMGCIPSGKMAWRTQRKLRRTGICFLARFGSGWVGWLCASLEMQHTVPCACVPGPGNKGGRIHSDGPLLPISPKQGKWSLKIGGRKPRSGGFPQGLGAMVTHVD